MGKICTTIDDDIYLEAREAYEYRFGRWKKGSFKDLLEKSLELFIKEFSIPGKRRKTQ